MHRGNSGLLSDDSSEAYWARRGMTGVANIEGARKKVASPGTRRIDRELGSSLRSLAFMDNDDDLSPYAKARMQKLESQVPPQSTSGGKVPSSSRLGDEQAQPGSFTSNMASTVDGPAVHLNPLALGPSGHLRARSSSNEVSPNSFARPASEAWTPSGSTNPSIPSTPAHLQHASFWNDYAASSSSPTRGSHSPAPSSAHSSSPRPRSALTSSLLEQRTAASPSSLHYQTSAAGASPAARAYMQATGAHSRQTSSSVSPHTSPRAAKRTLSPLGWVDELQPSLGQSFAAPSFSGASSSRRGSVASSSSKSAQPYLPESVMPPNRPGIYRPPHLRHRNSGSGLISTSMAHYDRVRTPSLRGQSRSRESSLSAPHRSSFSISRPPSTVPISEDEISTMQQDVDMTQSPVLVAPLTAEAVAKHLNTTQSPALQLGRTFTLSSLASSRYADELEEQYEAQYQQHDSFASQQGRFSRFDLGPLRQSIASVAGSDDFELSAEDMMRSSLTDSYMMSRRNSMASGRGFEGVVDIFEIGDRLGPGMVHDGHVVTIAETSSGFQDQEGDLTGSRLEVTRKLGEGSYACVYLVREVFDDEDDDKRRFGEAAGESPETASSIQFGSTPTAAHVSTRAAPRQSLGATSESGDVTLTNDTGTGNTLGSDLGSTLKAHESPLASRQAREQSARPPAREFALKCLCKRDLTPEMLEVQRLEATIHQSIPAHANIVTLYRTYETPEWLFLVLEYCPGQDLFYWLEQAQDDLQTPDIEVTPHVNHFTISEEDTDASGTTPVDPSLLSTTAGISILSRRRLRLITRMFRQMCDAVQFCHDRGISHRDLKPENFIVEDSRLSDSPSRMTSPVSSSDSSLREGGDRKVIVKLTDFGLASAEERCHDFECGSKPYMSYECRNNVEPSYDPKLADVWSLGVVLLNMLFHRNPFKEPSVERCPSFAAFREDPVRFLVEAFDGLTESAATFLSRRVFCDAQSNNRVSAAEFGSWSADLVEHMGLLDTTRSSTPSRGAAMGITSALQHSRSRSSLLSASSSVIMLSSLASPGVEPAIPEHTSTLDDSFDFNSPAATLDEGENEEALEVLVNHSPEPQSRRGSVTTTSNSESVADAETSRGRSDTRDEDESSDDEQESSKPTAQGRRRKRGARKSRSSSKQHTVPSSPVSSTPEFLLRERPSLDHMRLRADSVTPNHDAILTGLAEASQNLAREISKATQEKRMVDAVIANHFTARPAQDVYNADRRGSTASDTHAPRSPAMRATGDEVLRTPDTQSTPWRNANQSTATLASVSSRVSLASDNASLYSTASAPAAYARKSQESSKPRHSRGVFGKSTSGLPSISEKGKKELDASYLAEIFGGSAASRPSQSRRDRDRAGRSELHSYHGRDFSADPYRGSSRRDAHRHEPRGAAPSAATSSGSSASTSKHFLSSNTSRNTSVGPSASPLTSGRSSDASLPYRPNGHDELVALQAANAPRGTPIVIPNGSTTKAATAAASASQKIASSASTEQHKKSGSTGGESKGGSGFSKFFKGRS